MHTEFLSEHLNERDLKDLGVDYNIFGNMEGGVD
jgi:hypothetical protein